MNRYKIGPMPAQADAALLAELTKVEVATIGHFRHRGFVDHAIAAINPPSRTIVGTAVTVAIPATDSTLMQHALGLLRPGDILVVDRLGDYRHACLGGGVAFACNAKGALGVVLDGPCTDPHEITEIGMPVWCRGVSQITTRQTDLGGSLNLPIACGNVPVMPGDIIMADRCGVLVLPPDEAAELLEEALRRQARPSRWDQLAEGLAFGELTGANKVVAAALAQTSK